MFTGEIDLDRAIWDPEYRWQVLQFLNSEAAQRRPANDERSNLDRVSGRNRSSTLSGPRKAGRSGS